MDKEDFLYLFNELRTRRHIRLRERLLIKEKQRRERSFQDVTNNLSILSGEKGEYLFTKEQTKKTEIEEKLTKRAHVREKINNFYTTFSAYSHVTFLTLESLVDWEKGEGFRDRDAIYYGYSYDESQFTVCCDDLWEVIDLIIVIIVLEKSRFYGYSPPVDLLRAYIPKHAGAENLFNFIMQNNLATKLPITSMMIQVWQNP